MRRPTLSQERKRKRKSACCVRNDSVGGVARRERAQRCCAPTKEIAHRPVPPDLAWSVRANIMPPTRSALVPTGPEAAVNKTLKIVLIVVAVLVVVVLVAPFLIPVNQFRPIIEEKASAALGRKVQLGNISLSLISGSLSAENLSIGDDPKFSSVPFLTAKSLNVGLEMMPLILSKTLNVTGVTIASPKVTLLHNAAGQWNYSSLGASAAKAQAKQPPAEKPSGAAGAAEVSIKKLTLSDGSIIVGSTTSQKHFQVSGYGHRRSARWRQAEAGRQVRPGGPSGYCAYSTECQAQRHGLESCFHRFPRSFLGARRHCGSRRRPFVAKRRSADQRERQAFQGASDRRWFSGWSSCDREFQYEVQSPQERRRAGTIHTEDRQCGGAPVRHISVAWGRNHRQREGRRREHARTRPGGLSSCARHPPSERRFGGRRRAQHKSEYNRADQQTDHYGDSWAVQRQACGLRPGIEDVYDFRADGPENRPGFGHRKNHDQFAHGSYRAGSGEFPGGDSRAGDAGWGGHAGFEK
ncbi:MAG: hypothetical protein DMG47_20270 [Acidobacteria bacterium]|nr:MAG: hypothetical protein DMG47_20270 [Acidobacteriota bacterium]